MDRATALSLIFFVGCLFLSIGLPAALRLAGGLAISVGCLCIGGALAYWPVLRVYPAVGEAAHRCGPVVVGVGVGIGVMVLLRLTIYLADPDRRRDALSRCRQAVSMAVRRSARVKPRSEA